MGCLMSGGRGRVALWGRVRGDGGFIPAQLCCVIAYGSQWEGTREGTVRADSPSSAIWLSTRLIEWGVSCRLSSQPALALMLLCDVG